jgi:hypothetical protein
MNGINIRMFGMNVKCESRNIGGLFKVNCGAMDENLRRLKKILEAK